MSTEFRFFFGFFILITCLMVTIAIALIETLTGSVAWAMLFAIAAILQGYALPSFLEWLTMLGHKEV